MTPIGIGIGIGWGGRVAARPRYHVTSSSYAPSSGDTVAITAQLLNADGTDDATSGRTVTWSNTGAGGSFSLSATMTNGSGIASVNFTVGAGGVTHTVRATDDTGVRGRSPAIAVAAVSGTAALDAFNALFNGGTLVIHDSVNGDVLTYALATPAATSTGVDTGSLNFSPAQPNNTVNATDNAPNTITAQIKSADDSAEAWPTVSISPDLSGMIVLSPNGDVTPATWNGDAVAINSATVTLAAVDHYVAAPATTTPAPGSPDEIIFQAVDVDGNPLLISGLVLTASLTGAGSLSGSPATTTGDGKATITLTPGTNGQTSVVDVVDGDGKTGTSGTITATTNNAILLGANAYMSGSGFMAIQDATAFCHVVRIRGDVLINSGAGMSIAECRNGTGFQLKALVSGGNVVIYARNESVGDKAAASYPTASIGSTTWYRVVAWWDTDALDEQYVALWSESGGGTLLASGTDTDMTAIVSGTRGDIAINYTPFIGAQDFSLAINWSAIYGGAIGTGYPAKPTDSDPGILVNFPMQEASGNDTADSISSGVLTLTAGTGSLTWITAP